MDLWKAASAFSSLARKNKVSGTVEYLGNWISGSNSTVLYGTVDGNERERKKNCGSFLFRSARKLSIECYVVRRLMPTTLNTTVGQPGGSGGV